MQKICLLLFISFCINVFGQEISVFYKLEYKPQLNSDKLENEEMLLNIFPNEQTSYFYSYAGIKIDSLSNEIRMSTNSSEKAHLISLLPSKNFWFTIKKTYTANYTEVLEGISGDDYLYSEVLNLKWKIATEEKEIKGYNCRKATTTLGGRTWEAWFTEAIPIPDGPYKFGGLPGLILEVSSIDKDYFFTMVGIQNKNLPNKWNTKLAIKLKNKKEMLNYKEKYIKSPSAKARLEDQQMGLSSGAIVNGVKYSAEESYQLLDKEVWDWMEKHNNPIEKNDIWVK